MLQRCFLSFRTQNKNPKSFDFGFLARRKRFELLTFWSVARRSIQLS